MSIGDSSSISIEQLDGDKRRVDLRGPALPFRGASWKTKQSIVTTWYPGNPAEATQQILGAQELPSSWEGMWHRTQMGKVPSRVYDGPEDGTGSPITHPTTLRDVLDEIFYSGSKLRVTWTVNTAEGNGPRNTITRIGRASDWEFPHDGVHDIAWKITFDWSGRGRTNQKVVATRDADANGANAALLAVLADASATAIGINKGKTILGTRFKAPSTFNLGQIESLANYPNVIVAEFARNVTKITSTFKQIAGIVNTVKNLPFSTTNTLLSSVRNTRSVCHTFIDAMTRTPVELQTTKRQVRDIVRAHIVYGDNVEAALRVARASQEYESKLLPVVGQNQGGRVPAKKQAQARKLLAVHVVKEGDTLVALSQRYYNSPDHGADIAKANGLPWQTIKVDKGKTLVIPTLGNGAL
jgi:LysM repeat protein